MDKRHFRKMQIAQKVRKTPENQRFSGVFELRGKDLNQRPPGYEPDELPNCSTPRHCPASGGYILAVKLLSLFMTAS